MSKERLTILMSVSSKGEKFEPLIIGKAKNEDVLKTKIYQCSIVTQIKKHGLHQQFPKIVWFH